MKLKTEVSICILFLKGMSLFAQEPSDSSRQLKEVLITADRLVNFSSGTKVERIDSLALERFSASNLAELLNNESPLFIKSYGTGSLALTSFRGGSAGQTAILWNGFNLNSPMNGQLDLALVPGSFINKVDIQYGGSSALWGSGAVGGTILLGNEVSFDKGLTISLVAAAGSFANYQQNLNVEMSKQRWVSSLKVFSHSAENNFLFQNPFMGKSVKMRQSNAQLNQWGFLAENYLKINSSQRINFRLWYQDNDRNIPPTMLQASNTSKQKDEMLRLTSEWQRTGIKLSYFIRAALFDEDLLYGDTSYDYSVHSHSLNFISEAEARIKSGRNNLLNVGINSTRAKAFSEGYPAGGKQNRIAVFSSYTFRSPSKKLNLSLAARQEMQENTVLPFTWSAGGDYRLFKSIVFKASAAKVYRIPTFNDLFWIPGGNPELRPESGYSSEAGLKTERTNNKKNITFKSELTAFRRRINNWIIWLPKQGTWTPQNLMEVFSRGAETRSSVSLSKKKFIFSLELLTSYVVSTNERSTTVNDGSIGKQLIYVPVYSGHIKFSAAYKSLNIVYTQTYNGYRYTSTDHSTYLPPFYIGSLYLNKKWGKAKTQLSTFLQINNLFKEIYQLIPTRAMPLRNFQAGISLKFNSPNKNSKNKQK